ncbi:leucine-rich repeat-containing protein 3 [Phascolarctos cinereus]|uniref:Leucine-rich repeat-containing protein 3 n=1 Tax=Phascolarctos cinereus TaxID=38626 RepID=A0A6P5JWG9_PHACI|nr:leucine-rich repeat-containing protein 3 [Phascolarctos cinereus]XP_020835675.1 leucine-rich repeat-containing protein 3 [Phascolarctos cinereus]
MEAKLSRDRSTLGERGCHADPTKPLCTMITMLQIGADLRSSALVPSRGALCLFLLLLYLPLGISCPPHCQCSDGSGLMTVHCSSKNLKEIPRDIPKDTVFLKLDANQLTHIPSHAFSGLTLLQELDLSQNTIEKLDTAAFQGLSSGLKLLDLSHNHLRSLPKEALARLKAKIRLSHNPWHCECTLQEVLWEVKLDPVSVNEMACQTSVQEEAIGKPLVQVLDSGANFCSSRHKTTDVAMFVTMFGWFAMVITYIIHYVRQNQDDARKHLECLKNMSPGTLAIGSASGVGLEL